MYTVQYIVYNISQIGNWNILICSVARCLFPKLTKSWYGGNIPHMQRLGLCTSQYLVPIPWRAFYILGSPCYYTLTRQYSSIEMLRWYWWKTKTWQICCGSGLICRSRINILDTDSKVISNGAGNPVFFKNSFNVCLSFIKDLPRGFWEKNNVLQVLVFRLFISLFIL